MSDQQFLNELRQMVAKLNLDLRGLNVLTEAANGAYASTPLLAALAGAQVWAFGKDTSFGSYQSVCGNLKKLANDLGINRQIHFTDSLHSLELASIHLITNSGMLRPLDRQLIGCLSQGTAISVMYEAWELREGEIDLQACLENHVFVAGVNENIAELRIFDDLPKSVLRSLELANLELPKHTPVALLCDNPFSQYLLKGLQDRFDNVELLSAVSELGRRSFGLIVVALLPSQAGGTKVRLPSGFTGVVCQLWGDIERSQSDAIQWIPETVPREGHMGIALTVLGDSPIIRLQAGGLKCGEQMLKAKPDRKDIIQWVVSPKDLKSHSYG